MKLRSLISVLTFAVSASASQFTIPEWVEDTCVVVLKGERPMGTAFIVGVKHEEFTITYLVSAKHVIRDALSADGSLSVRLNRKNTPGAETVTFFPENLSGSRWFEPKNTAIDLAIVPLPIMNRADQLRFAVMTLSDSTDELLATKGWLKKYTVRPGDTAFLLGLVPYLYSRERTIVFSRFGTISLLTDEELDLPGGKQNVYFIDCPSYGGNSGGPVYVQIERDENATTLGGWRIALLGIVTEFVPSQLRTAEVEVSDKQKQVIGLENTGISKVVPVDFIAEVLFSDAQKNFRSLIARRARLKNIMPDLESR